MLLELMLNLPIPLFLQGASVRGTPSVPTCFFCAPKACRVCYYRRRLVASYMVFKMAALVHLSHIFCLPMTTFSLPKVAIVVWLLWNLLCIYIVKDRGNLLITSPQSFLRSIVLML
ncbi:hypothetical protein VPH35_105229 [Triticum aestivum]